jgi:hypothetical protein
MWRIMVSMTNLSMRSSLGLQLYLAPPVEKETMLILEKDDLEISSSKDSPFGHDVFRQNADPVQGDVAPLLPFSDHTSPTDSEQTSILRLLYVLTSPNNLLKSHKIEFNPRPRFIYLLTFHQMNYIH